MKHPLCTKAGVHPWHAFVVQSAGEDGEPAYEQHGCPGHHEAEPLHGHGGGPHPDSCPRCFIENRR
jgi:hypothetical protein